MKHPVNMAMKGDAYPRQNPRGFVLLMALVLVLIAGVALAGIAAQSMFSALNSQSEVEELQRRWAILSLRKTLAGRVADTLAKAEGADQGSQRGGNSSEGDVVAIKEWRTNLDLAGHRYTLVFTDEQAKLNVNTLLEDHSSARLTGWLLRNTRAMRNDAAGNVQVRVQPLVDDAFDDGGGRVMRRLGAYGQLFTGAGPWDLVGTEAGAGLATDLTCWGNGTVNFRRASAEVLEAICDDVLSSGQIRDLIQTRSEEPDVSLNQVLASMDGLTEDQIRQVEGKLTANSTCHGLWVIAQAQKRAWHTLLIVEGSQDSFTGSTDEASGNGQRRLFELNW